MDKDRCSIHLQILKHDSMIVHLHEKHDLSASIQDAPLHAVTDLLVLQGKRTDCIPASETPAKHCSTTHVTESPPDDANSEGPFQGTTAPNKKCKPAAGRCLWRSVYQLAISLRYAPAMHVFVAMQRHYAFASTPCD